jgi:hypothetical protein
MRAGDTRKYPMCRFHIPIEKPEEVIPRLGKGELHWKKGRSAFELASSWMLAAPMPSKVRTVLNLAEEWRDAVLLDGIFERETELGTRGRPSQTDLLCIVGLPIGNAVLGIEGKVDEPFGPRVSEWLSDDAVGGRKARLKALCASLEINPDSTGNLFYQLFHRTCAVLYEAQRFRYGQAAMLVHSFSTSDAWLPEFMQFAEAVRMPVSGSGTISAPRMCEGISMRLGWVSDKPLP